MSNPLLGQILGSVFAGGLGRGNMAAAGTSGQPSNPVQSGGLTDMLGGLLGRGMPLGSSKGGMLTAMLLPLAMQWMQRNGGVGAVLDRFRQKGYASHANSWVSTGTNNALDADAVHAVVGPDELSRLSKQLGVPEDEVSHGFAEIIPEVANQLSPDGTLPPQADHALDAGLSTLEKELNEIQTSTSA